MKDRESGVFAITNRATEKIFIGMSVDLKATKNSYFNKLRGGICSNFELQEDFDRFGEAEFEFDVLEYCSKEELYKKRRFYLEFYRTHKDVYGRRKGIRHQSAETKKKISSANRGSKRNEEERMRMSLACRGRKHTEVVRKKIGAASLGRTKSKKVRQKISETLKGQEFTEERKQKISKSLRGIIYSAEHMQKFHEGTKRFWGSPENREKMGRLRKELWKDPGYREKQMRD